MLAPFLLMGCGVGGERGERKEGRPPATAAPGLSGGTMVAAAAVESQRDVRSRDERDKSCRDRIAALRALEPVALPGPGDEARARLLAEVKATPVLFLERPESPNADPVVKGLRRQLEKSELPGRPLARLLANSKRFPAFLRSIVLSDGYLYAEAPALGTALAEALTPSDLFHDPEIVIERGALRMTARRGEDGRYVYADGPEAGSLARMVLWDRLWAPGAEPGDPKHVDVRALADELGFDTIAVERMTRGGIVALARYAGMDVPTVLEPKGARLTPVCELLPADDRPVVLARERAARSRRVLGALRAVIAEQVAEALPFDEPKTEFGQEDGKLRQEWRLAYRDGRTRYEFNGDRYPVFDRQGRPRVPQVCIDFVFDTLERLGGTWYGREDMPRARSVGRIDFDALAMENRRNVEEFLALAGRRSDLFELRSVPPEERVALERRDRFFSTLYAKRAQYVPGDIVVILGLRDDDKLHYHSFFVLDSDPVTGMPTLVAGNSGRPRVRAWAVEMAPAPKRSLFARVRPRLEWLEAVAAP